MTLVTAEGSLTFAEAEGTDVRPVLSEISNLSWPRIAIVQRARLIDKAPCPSLLAFDDSYFKLSILVCVANCGCLETKLENVPNVQCPSAVALPGVGLSSTSSQTPPVHTISFAGTVHAQ